MGTLDFSRALDELKNGRFVARNGWGDTGEYVFLIGNSMSQGNGWTFTNGRNDNVEMLPFLALRTADGKVTPWVINQIDALATDWVIVR